MEKPEFSCHLDNGCYLECLDYHNGQMEIWDELQKSKILLNDLKLTEEQKGVMV
jgi:hypothetical protein